MPQSNTTIAISYAVKKGWLFLLVFIQVISLYGNRTGEPVKLAVIGLTHTHVHWLLGRPQMSDIEIVGIVEPNADLSKRFTTQHGISMDLVYTTIDDMLVEIKPDAVAAFGSIYEHLQVVEKFAPLGVHVMVEKPLAVSIEHAQKMEALALKHKIILFTNYETTWYASHARAYEMIQENQIGELRKVVVHDGHKGPEEIGVNEEFLSWLKDPVQNGGGAITDFGCYGANLVTWFNEGEMPISVTAVLQTFKPEKYPKVDDEATIILTFPRMQAIIQASWNWPISRKDMELYGTIGQIFCDTASDIRVQLSEDHPVQHKSLPDLAYPDNDPFAKFASLIKGTSSLEKFDPSALENNMRVMEILEAAKKSAQLNKTVYLK